MDRLSKEKRSEIMSKIRGKNTCPELAVRKLVFSLGYRYRLHVNNLPGKPDLVFPGSKKVIFVHGCFWHSHPGCRRAFMPKSNVDYWKAKLERNRILDAEHESALVALKWRFLVIWECQIKDAEALKRRLKEFLS
jgi:DNA mismatch endonuclease (patch repair protein)